MKMRYVISAIVAVAVLIVAVIVIAPFGSGGCPKEDPQIIGCIDVPNGIKVGK